MNILAVSDKESELVYSPQIKNRFNDIDLVISCGDLSYFYLEYIISMLDMPLYFVRGNHAKDIEISSYGSRKAPWGAFDLHRKMRIDQKNNLLLAGIQGSLRYNNGDYQYSQYQMWKMVFELVPTLMLNKIRYGRSLDIFVTHAPPWGIHDADDPAHRGIKAFRWLIEKFQPVYHLHGHVHLIQPGMTTETRLANTTILNTYGFRKFAFQQH